MTLMKKNNNSGIWVMLAIGLLAGGLLILLDASLLLKILFVVMGVFTVIANVPGVVAGIVDFSTRTGKFTLISSAVSVLVGFLMIFKHSALLMVFLGVYMLVLPLIGILLASDKKKQLMSELPKMILGVVLLVVGPAETLGILFDVAGTIILVLSVVIALVMLARAKRYSSKTGGRIFADTDGDGTIDTVFVDTTGDGKPDLGVDYNEKK